MDSKFKTKIIGTEDGVEIPIPKEIAEQHDMNTGDQVTVQIEPDNANRDE